MSEEITSTANKIQALRATISKENGLALSLARKSLLSIKTTGDALIELKELVGHGQFRNELMYLRISPTTAANHMRVARKWTSVAHLKSVKDALRLLNRVDDTQPAENEVTDDPPASPPPPKPRSRPAASEVIDAEVIEPLTEKETARLAELEAVVEKGIRKLPEMTGQDEPEEAQPEVKAKDCGPFLSIVHQLHELSQDELRELVRIIQTRWIR